MSFKQKVPLAVLRQFSSPKWLSYSNVCSEMGNSLISFIIPFSSPAKKKQTKKTTALASEMTELQADGNNIFTGHASNVVHPFK